MSDSEEAPKKSSGGSGAVMVILGFFAFAFMAGPMPTQAEIDARTATECTKIPNKESCVRSRAVGGDNKAAAKLDEFKRSTEETRVLIEQLQRKALPEYQTTEVVIGDKGKFVPLPPPTPHPGGYMGALKDVGGGLMRHDLLKQ